MKNKLLLTIMNILLIYSCSSDDHSVVDNERYNKYVDTSETLSFNSKEELLSSIENLDLSVTIKPKARGAEHFISAEDAYLYDNEEGDTEYLSFLVPDEKYRHFLNKNLEIVVNDTIYKVTKNGTFLSHIKNREELLGSIEKFTEFRNISENLKVLGNVKVINTFGLWNNNIDSPIMNDNFFDDNDNDLSIDNSSKSVYARSGNDGGISKSQIESFPTIGTVNVSVIDKILHFNPGYLGHTKLRFNNVRNRKLYISLYRNDYGFGVSIGIDCKVMKKLWHGMKWGRMKNWDAGIYYGLSSLIVSQKIKTPEFDTFANNENRQIIGKKWNESIKYDNIFDASNQQNSPFSGKWTPEYNSNKNPFVLPFISNFADYFERDKIAHKIEDFLISKGAKFLKGVVNNNQKKSIQLAFVSEREKTIYHFFKNDLSWNGGGYRIKDTFLRYNRKFLLTLHIKGDRNIGYKDFKGSLSEDDFIGSPNIISCEALVYTRDGDEWIGAKIIK